MLSTRKRKDAVESEIKVQVCLFGFDLLYLNGESLVKKNFDERRRLLRECFNEIEGEFHFAKVMINLIFCYLIFKERSSFYASVFLSDRPSVRGGTMHIAQNIERSQTVTSLILELEKF